MKKRYNVKVGRHGEEFVVRLLTDMGFTIVCTNFRCRMGEIDIIARRGQELHFVEVKTRLGCKLGHPEESVTTKKLERMKKAAEFFLARLGDTDYEIVFDVMALEINYIANCA